MTEHCNNGGCTKPIYRGKYCFRCWAGVKWTSIVQRLENKMGNCNSYVGVPLGFTKETLIKWVMDNPPPATMFKPSIDRIDPVKGYVPGNIRWLEFRKNCMGCQRDVKDGFKICPICKRILELNKVNFGTNYGKKYGEQFQTYCRVCKHEYDRKWREDKKRISI